MLINTKFSVGDSIWFIVNAALYCSSITAIEVYTDTIETKTIYYTDIPASNGNMVKAVIGDKHAFATKDELINNTITERFYESIEKGSG